MGEGRAGERVHHEHILTTRRFKVNSQYLRCVLKTGESRAVCQVTHQSLDKRGSPDPHE